MGINISRNTLENTATSSPQDALETLADGFLKDNPSWKPLAEGISKIFQDAFAGKSILEILTIFTDIIGFVPGPLGFVAGLAGTALSIAIYDQKVKNGQVSELDHMDLIMGCMGCFMSCVPGGRAAARIGSNAAKIAAVGTRKTKIVSKTIRLMDKTVAAGFRTVQRMTPQISVSQLSAVKGLVGNTKQLLAQSSKYKEGIAAFMDFYGQLTALENILSPIPIGSLDDSDGSELLNLSRQSLIDVLVALSKTSKKIDTIGNSKQDTFNNLLILQYGTATINGAGLYTSGEIVSTTNNAVFIDNEIYNLRGRAITRLKVNPYSVVRINERSDWTYTNSSPSDILIFEFTQFPIADYSITVQTYDEKFMEKYDTNKMCSISVERTDGQFSRLCIGEALGVESSNIDRLMSKGGCMNHDLLMIRNLFIGPKTNVSLLKTEPRYAKQNDVLGAWSNSSSVEMKISGSLIQGLCLSKTVTSGIVYFAINALEAFVTVPFIYGNFVRIQYPDLTSRYLNLAECIVRRSGYYLEGGLLKFDAIQHNKKINSNQVWSSSNFFGSQNSNLSDSDFNTYTATIQEVSPWLEQDVSQGGVWPVYINSVYIANRKDWCQDRILGAQVAIFDKLRYLVWSQEPIGSVQLEYDFPTRNGLRFNRLAVSSWANNSINDLNKKCNFVQLIKVTDISGTSYDNWAVFRNPIPPSSEIPQIGYIKAPTSADIFGTLNNPSGNLNMGIAYINLPQTKTEEAILYRSIQILTKYSLHSGNPPNTASPISTLKFLLTKTNNTNFQVVNDFITSDPLDKTLVQLSIQITDMHYKGTFNGLFVYEFDLWRI